MLSLVITLAVIGLILYLINTYIPMSPVIRKVINIVVVVCVALWLLSVFGILGRMDTIGVPQLGGHSYSR
jgi:hypothetical protein